VEPERATVSKYQSYSTHMAHMVEATFSARNILIPDYRVREARVQLQGPDR
jgi:hypothetical protein